MPAGTCYNYKVNTNASAKESENKCLRLKLEKTKTLKAHCVVSRENAPATVSSAIFVRRNFMKNLP